MQIDENVILEYIQRKGYQYKENGEEYMIRECMFCPKPHYNKSDNLYKLCEFRVWVHVQVH